MISNKKRLNTALALNLLIVVFDSYALFMAFFSDKGGFKWQFLQYFCHIANILAVLSSLYAAFVIMAEREHPRGNKATYPARLSAFVTTTCLIFSFIITVCVLVPLDSFGKGRLYLLSSYFFFEHLVCPILAFLTISVFGDYRRFGNREALTAVIPIAAYAAVMFLLNILKVMDAPFYFFSVYTQSWYVSVMWFIGLIALAYGSAWLLIFLARKIKVAEVA